MAATPEEIVIDNVTELLIKELPWLAENNRSNLDIRDIAMVLIDGGFIPVEG